MKFEINLLRWLPLMMWMAAGSTLPSTPAWGQEKTEPADVPVVTDDAEPAADAPTADEPTETKKPSKPADEPEPEPAPEPEPDAIANRNLKIEAEVRSDLPKGVVVAQGGREHGFAVHFVYGRPVLDVRIAGEITRLAAKRVVIGRIKLTASLDEKKMTLSIQGVESLSADSPGLIPEQPQEARSIGTDSQTAAGEYRLPNDFVGDVIQVEVTAKP